MALRDIRELTDSPEAYAEELARRWGGLLSYRYIGAQSPEMNVTSRTRPSASVTTCATAPVDSCWHLWPSPHPRAAVGATSTWCRTPSSTHARSLTPVMMSAASGHGEPEAGSPDGLQPFHHRGCRPPGRVLALTEGQAVSLGVPPSGIEKFDPEPIVVEDSPDLPPLWQVFGGERRVDGRGASGLVVEPGSPDGALHIGPQQVIMEAAAMEVAAATAGTDWLQAVSSHVMFLARGKAGPFRVEVEPFRGLEAVGVRAMIHDEGAEDRAITAASYLFRVVG